MIAVRERALGRLSRRRRRSRRRRALQLKDFVLGAVAGSGIFVILLGLVAAVLAVVLLILYIVRATRRADPDRRRAAALDHARAAADRRARAFVVARHDAPRSVCRSRRRSCSRPRCASSSTSGGRQALGLSVTGNLIDLLVCLCLFWILIRIPFWAKDLAFSGRRTMVGQAARTYVLARVGRKALFS